MMHLKTRSIIWLILSCLTIAGCTDHGLAVSAHKKNVSWDSGFTLPSLLESSIKINKKTDIAKLLDAPWYYRFKMINTKNGLGAFSSCHDYFTQSTKQTRTREESEMSAYLELKNMCDAAKILMTAIDAQKSYLPKSPLDKSLPTVWPKAIALQISSQEEKRTLKDPYLKTWSDAEVSPRI